MGDPSFFGWFVPIIPIGGVAILVIFVIGLVMEGKAGGRSQGLRNAFMYSVATLSLGVVVASTVFLLNLGLRTTVLPKADTQQGWDTPPTLMFEAKNQTTFIPETATCKSSCELSDTDKTYFTTWKDSYQQWRTTHNAGSPRNQRDAVNGFSFLFVSLVLFVIFFRMIQRDHRSEAGPGPMRSFYYYGFALVGLVMMVITCILLINLGLKTWVFPKAGDVTTNTMPIGAVSLAGPELAPYQSVKNCADACGFSKEDVALVDQWIKDTNRIRQGFQTPPNKQRDLATELPIFAVGIPLFLYHFLSIRRQTKNGSAPVPPSPKIA